MYRALGRTAWSQAEFVTPRELNASQRIPKPIVMSGARVHQDEKYQECHLSSRPVNLLGIYEIRFAGHNCLHLLP